MEQEDRKSTRGAALEKSESNASGFDEPLSDRSRERLSEDRGIRNAGTRTIGHRPGGAKAGREMSFPVRVEAAPPPVERSIFPQILAALPESVRKLRGIIGSYRSESVGAKSIRLASPGSG